MTGCGRAGIGEIGEERGAPGEKEVGREVLREEMIEIEIAELEMVTGIAQGTGIGSGIWMGAERRRETGRERGIETGIETGKEGTETDTKGLHALFRLAWPVEICCHKMTDLASYHLCEKGFDTWCTRQ